MLKLNTKVRNEIVGALHQLVVPVAAGATLMQIVQILGNLKEEEEMVDGVLPEKQPEETAPEEVEKENG